MIQLAETVQYCADQKVNLPANPHIPTRDPEAVRAVNSLCRRQTLTSSRTSSLRELQGCGELRVSRRSRPSLQIGRLACCRDGRTVSGSRSRDYEEIGRHDLADVIPQEPARGLRWKLAPAHHVLRDGRLTDVDPEFQHSP
jgi:hypothetical protein